MDSPKRKMQKQKDYLRKKVIRRAQRNRKLEMNSLQKIAEKDLKKRLRITPKRRSFDNGKNIMYIRQNGDPISFDEYGNLIDLVTGESGTMLLPNVNVDPSILYQAQQTYNKERDLLRKILIENRPSAIETPQRGIPLLAVYPEFDLLSAGLITKDITKFLLNKHNINKIKINPTDINSTMVDSNLLKKNANDIMWKLDYNDPKWIASKGVHYDNIPEEVVSDFDKQVIDRILYDNRPKNARPNLKAARDYLEKSYKDGGYDIYSKELFKQAGIDAKGVSHESSGRIALSQKDYNTLFHELRHRLQDHIELTDVQQKYANSAYEGFDKILKSRLNNHEYDFSKEIITTNADARKLLLRKAKLNNAALEEQDKYIDAVNGGDILDAIYESNNYGRIYIDELTRQGKLTLEKVNLLRNAFKYVPAILPAVKINKKKQVNKFDNGKNLLLLNLIDTGSFGNSRYVYDAMNAMGISDPTINFLQNHSNKNK